MFWDNYTRHLQAMVGALKNHGRRVARIQTTAFDCRHYPVTVDLTQGQHELRLVFVNDLAVDGEDRNLVLEKVVFSRE